MFKSIRILLSIYYWNNHTNNNLKSSTFCCKKRERFKIRSIWLPSVSMECKVSRYVIIQHLIIKKRNVEIINVERLYSSSFSIPLFIHSFLSAQQFLIFPPLPAPKKKRKQFFQLLSILEIHAYAYLRRQFIS